MGKKPAGQTSNHGTGNADGVDEDLDLNLDDDGDGGSDDDDSDDDGGGEGQGEQLSIQEQIEAGIAAALPTITRTFQSEMDRRINSAVAKNRNRAPGKPAGKDKDEDNDQGGAAVVADVRGARIAFREYLPESIKLLSGEERALASEFGQAQIKARALAGFEDEDEVGREVAEATADFLKKARSFYSNRTKRVLEKNGLLSQQSQGQQVPGAKTPPAGTQSAFEEARKKDMELFPERYRDQQK